MTNSLPLSSAGGHKRAYSESYQLAFDRLKLNDLDGICQRSGASRQSEGAISLRFLGQDYTIDINQRTVASAICIPDMTDSLVMLHYLVTAADQLEGAPQSITFKELRDGRNYYPTFFKRAIEPVLKRFGNSPDALIAVAAKYHGRPTSQGDISIRFEVLPHVNLTWVLWSGDKDFPADGTVIFDSTIINYLPIEDIAAICQSITMKLCAMDTGNTPGL